MPLTSEQDLELLEAYGDGELTTAEEDALRARLSSEPELTAAMASLRGDRDVRALVWKSYEPEPAVIESLVARVHASVDRNTIWAGRLSKLRLVLSAAACILVGFLVGRVAYRGEAGTAGRPSGAMSVVQVPGSGGSVPGVTTVNAPVQFRIVDADNKPVTLQPFNSQRDAQEFIDAYNRWQRQQEQLRTGGGTAPTVESF